MFRQNISYENWGGKAGKYRLVDDKGNNIDKSPEDTCNRVASNLADLEKDKDYWYSEFYRIIGTKFAGGGRIMANIGAKNYKKEVSPINCVVMSQIPDSMVGIMKVATDASVTLKAGCGVGYDFSTLRPKGAHVYGSGSGTSGVISFMKIFDAICATVLSGGARRGAQMGCLDIQSPDIEEFISCKRQDGVLRNFNLSVLITDKFMKAVENDEYWDLWFWIKIRNDKELDEIKEKTICTIKKDDIPYNHSEYDYFKFDEDHVEIIYNGTSPNDIFKKEVFKTVKAKYLFDLIMTSTYTFSEPGFLLIDRINVENNLWFIESIRATNPCGEQPLGPYSNCLLGSIILTDYVFDPFTDEVSFDWESYRKDICVAARLLDNVVDVSNLPLKELTEKIKFQRRHGMGFTGLGSMFNMMGFKYGSEESIKFAEKLSLILAQQNLLESIKLAEEKGCAPFCSSLESREKFIDSVYMKRLLDSFPNKEDLKSKILAHGVRWSHATSIAPTGTLSLVWGNNCSNGLEPVYSNSYMRNIRIVGRKTKIQEEVFDYAYMLWKEINNDKELPSYWSTTENISVNDHLNIQASIQKWIDSATSKTINIPTDYPFDDFKKVYMDGWKKGLKGITTFRYNPEIFSGVLVQKQDLEKTLYTFVLEDNSEVTVKGTDLIEYDGETHVASNLFDALKEGLYGNM